MNKINKKINYLKSKNENKNNTFVIKENPEKKKEKKEKKEEGPEIIIYN